MAKQGKLNRQSFKVNHQNCGCETWPMSVRDEKRMATSEMRMVRWPMVVSLLEHRGNEEILEEARVEPIAMVMRRMEWFGHVKGRDEIENIRAVVEMKIEGKRRSALEEDRSCGGKTLLEGS